MPDRSPEGQRGILMSAWGNDIQHLLSLPWLTAEAATISFGVYSMQKQLRKKVPLYLGQG